MKPVRVMSTAALFLLFGIAAPANGSQEKPEEKAPPPKQEQPARPAKQEEAKAPKQQQEAKPEKQQQAKAPKQEPKAKTEKQEQAKAPKQEQEAIAAQRAQPALRLSARGSGRIPDDRFRASFGRAHDFHMGNPVLVGGYSRFQYGGFWFGFVQPWPVGWYYTDDVYIDYVDGGYYMYNPYYPGARFSISVVI